MYAKLHKRKDEVRASAAVPSVDSFYRRMGRFQVRVDFCQRTHDGNQRVQALTDWLLSNWHKQQEERDDQTTRDR